MSGPIEMQVGKAAARAMARLARDRLDNWHRERLAEEARSLIPVRAADQLIEQLSPDQMSRLDAFLGSPDFEQLAMQLVLVLLPLGKGPTEEIRADIREALRACLRHSVGLGSDALLGITDAVFHALEVACTDAGFTPDRRPRALDTTVVAVKGHLAALAARNARLLARVGDLATVHSSAELLRRQVAALHAQMRLPHTGASRSVSWEQLYVPPVLAPEPVGSWLPDLSLLAEPACRTVVLGDPGAGKSTLAARVARQTALEDEGRVPFLVVWRRLVEELRRGGRTLAELLALVARDPYQVELSADAVEYLLCNGRAVVLLDGLDELTDLELRQHTVTLVNAFANRYPLVPVLVTARRVGYYEAPLMSALFRTAVIAQMDEERARQYATNWFALDEGTVPQERDQLREAFLRESDSIADLRGNPLLLSLLCAMYASEQYLPRNRALIYERCAITMFERWDSMRGIRMPLRFQGHVRGAVQELAWQMFAVQDVSELSRHHVLRILVRFLEAKRFDTDEAGRLAEDFLAFCAGRAWVLDEVGMVDGVPAYGFAHRTFLEYFTAERLARHHPSAEAMWQVLRTHLHDSRWTVVQQLATQLLDRNIDDGAAHLVDLALAAHTDPADGLALASFLADVVSHVALPPALLDSIAATALTAIRSTPLRSRQRFRVEMRDVRLTQGLDTPLWTLLSSAMYENLPYIFASLRAALADGTGTDHHPPLFVIDWSVTGTVWSDPQREQALRELAGKVRQDHPAAFNGQLAVARLWGVPDEVDDAELDRIFDSCGPACLYQSGQFLGMGIYPAAPTLLTRNPLPSAARHIRDLLLLCPRPWLPADEWNSDWSALVADEIPWEISRVTEAQEPGNGEDLAAFLILCLPYLETFADRRLFLQTSSTWVRNLLDIRQRLVNHALDWSSLPVSAAAYLQRWAQGAISVIG
jgi:hypothetical protein